MGLFTNELFGKTKVVSKSADDSITAAQSGYTFTNTAAINLTLPSAATVGLNYRFVVSDASYLKVTATAPNLIRYATGTTAAGGYFRSATSGNQIEISCTEAGYWQVISLDGTWTYDE